MEGDKAKGEEHRRGGYSPFPNSSESSISWLVTAGGGWGLTEGWAVAGAGYWMAASHLSRACGRRRRRAVWWWRWVDGVQGVEDLEGLQEGIIGIP